MINHRGSALNLFLSRPKNLKERENKKISSYYAENVFTDAKLRSYLSNDAYKAYNQSIEQGQKIDCRASWRTLKNSTTFAVFLRPLDRTQICLQLTSFVLSCHYRLYPNRTWECSSKYVRTGLFFIS